MQNKEYIKNNSKIFINEGNREIKIIYPCQKEIGIAMVYNIIRVYITYSQFTIIVDVIIFGPSIFFVLNQFIININYAFDNSYN